MADRVALITGSTRGIGRGVAKQLAKEGINIALNGRSRGEHVEEAIEACKREAVEVDFFRADISDPEAQKNLLSGIRDRWDRLDILVNNAGVAPAERKDILESDEESFDRVLAINLKGPYFLTQKVSNWMIEQVEENRNREPIIVNISSLSAYTSSPSRGEYCISKAGISMMTKLYADRLAEFGINVYEIRPGIISTDMTEGVRDKYDRMIYEEGLLPIERWGEPEDIGKAVSALAKGGYPYSTGEVINVDGGFHLRRL